MSKSWTAPSTKMHDWILTWCYLAVQIFYTASDFPTTIWIFFKMKNPPGSQLLKGSPLNKDSLTFKLQRHTPPLCLLPTTLPIYLLYTRIHHRHSVHTRPIYFSHTPQPLHFPHLIASLRGKCLPPLIPYHRNNTAQCSDTATLSAAQYKKVDTTPHVGTKMHKKALLQWLRLHAQFCLSGMCWWLYWTWGFICASTHCFRNSTRYLTSAVSYKVSNTLTRVTGFCIEFYSM